MIEGTNNTATQSTMAAALAAAGVVDLNAIPAEKVEQLGGNKAVSQSTATAQVEEDFPLEMIQALESAFAGLASPEFIAVAKNLSAEEKLALQKRFIDAINTAVTAELRAVVAEMSESKQLKNRNFMDAFAQITDFWFDKAAKVGQPAETAVA